jgi:hypothetical protein
VNFLQIAGVVLGSLCAAATASAGDSARPGRLLVFYGYPSLINGANGNVATAAGQFSPYTHVVLGDGLQASSHPDHAKTTQIVAHAQVASTKFFGYIDLGVSTQNLSIAMIDQRAAAWAAMGVDGVLLDDFGYDYGVTRERQNAAVLAVRSRGLRVIANAFRVEDAFASIASSANPAAAAPVLNAQDFYLYESHQVRLGVQDDASTWWGKSTALRQYRSSVGFGVLSVTTPADSGAFNATLWNYAWFSAALFDHTATGWGEKWYGASNSQAPLRAVPAVDDTPFVSPDVSVSGNVYARRTCLNELWINSATAAAGQTPVLDCADAIFADAFES